jgi:indole-3-glycerol phosphate synthase
VANILDQIIAHKREEIDAAKARVSQSDLESRAAEAAKPRNLFKSVTQSSRSMNVIAEIKRASPSAGQIREDFDPAALAQAYERGGAAAISCLTDERYFQGSLEFIDQIKAAVGLPVLRKDFIIDPYQLYESRVYGADAVLLIGECLTESHLIDLLILASQLQLTALVEVHDVETLLKVRPHIGFPHRGYCLLGINNRDLRTMETDLGHTMRLIGMVEDPTILVSESGIRTHDDIRRLRKAGLRAILDGEHLMRQPDPGEALHQLIYGETGSSDESEAE